MTFLYVALHFIFVHTSLITTGWKWNALQKTDSKFSDFCKFYRSPKLQPTTRQIKCFFWVVVILRVWVMVFLHWWKCLTYILLYDLLISNWAEDFKFHVLLSCLLHMMRMRCYEIDETRKKKVLKIYDALQEKQKSHNIATDDVTKCTKFDVIKNICMS